jgi:hypothetical protein
VYPICKTSRRRCADVQVKSETSAFAGAVEVGEGTTVGEVTVGYATPVAVYTSRALFPPQVVPGACCGEGGGKGGVSGQNDQEEEVKVRRRTSLQPMLQDEASMMRDESGSSLEPCRGVTRKSQHQASSLFLAKEYKPSIHPRTPDLRWRSQRRRQRSSTAGTGRLDQYEVEERGDENHVPQLESMPLDARRG